MAQSLMVVAPEAGTGKSVVSFGLLDQFERLGVRAIYFRPVGLSESVHPKVNSTLEASIASEEVPHGRQVTAVHCDEVTRAIQERRYDEVIDKILEVHSRLAETVDVIICEGVDSIRAFPTLDSDINLDIARNIDATMLLVTSARGYSIEEIASNITLACDQFQDRGVEIFGVIVNRVKLSEQGEQSDYLRRELQGSPISLFGLLPELPELSCARVCDVIQALDAQILSGGNHCEAPIRTVLVAAMGLENALHYFEAGALIITPGDREEILLAAAASYACRTTPRPSGVVLTGGFAPRRRVMALAKALSKEQLPILRVEPNTYETAISVHEVEPVLEHLHPRTLLAIRSAMEEYIDLGRLLKHRIEATKKVMTPRRFLRRLRRRAREDKKTIVLPEGHVERIIRAAVLIRRQDIASIILLGDPSKIHKVAQGIGVALPEDIEIVNPLDDVHFDEYVETLVELRKHKNMHTQLARDLMHDPTWFGTMMVYKGRADGMVSGATTTTQATLRPALQFIRTREGINTVSSVFLMCLPDRVLVYGDCAVVPKPTVDQLVEIGIASADTASAFGIEPRVAMLSYSTGASGSGEAVEAVREATQRIHERRPDLNVEGPIQYDAAIDPGVAKTKLPTSNVAGRATVFIFPDLNTGNNTYKAVQRSAGAIAVGPILQGLKKPVNDLSRGATVVDIVNTIVVTALQASAK